MALGQFGDTTCYFTSQFVNHRLICVSYFWLGAIFMERFHFLLFFLLITSCSDEHSYIKVKGSDTEVNLAVSLAEHFYKTNDHFSVSISGGGSGLGIASLLNGQADIANSSRPINAEEDSLFKVRGIDLKTVVFAEDATAFIVHSDFPIDTITVGLLGKILSGEYLSWKETTGTESGINIYGRQSNSGTHSFLKEKLKIQFSRNAKEMNGNAQILESIKLDKSGIGYVGAGYIAHGGSKQGIKVLYIKETEQSVAISPLDKVAIQEGRYFFQRPLYQFIPKGSWSKVRAFIDFEKSEQGQSIIENAGYYIVKTDING